MALITGDERASTELARLKRSRTVLRHRTSIEALPWRGDANPHLTSQTLIRAGNEIYGSGSDVADSIRWKTLPIPVTSLLLGIDDGPLPTLEAFTAVDVNPLQLIFGSGDLPLTAGAPVHVRNLFIDVVRWRLPTTSPKAPDNEERTPRAPAKSPPLSASFPPRPESLSWPPRAIMRSLPLVHVSWSSFVVPMMTLYPAGQHDGSSVGSVLISWETVTTLPAASLASQVTRVVPKGICAGALLVRLTIPQSSSATTPKSSPAASVQRVV